MSLSPPPVARPKLASWMFERGISVPAAAEALGCSEQTVRNISAAFDDPGRTVPREALLERIVAWTGGAVTAGDFYPAHLRGPQRYDHVRAREDVQ